MESRTRRRQKLENNQWLQELIRRVETKTPNPIEVGLVQQSKYPSHLSSHQSDTTQTRPVIPTMATLRFPLGINSLSIYLSSIYLSIYLVVVCHIALYRMIVLLMTLPSSSNPVT